MALPLEPLRRPADFAALQRGGTSRAHPLLVLRAVRNDLERTRVGFSTGRRLGTAVVRNRVRRRLRAIVRALSSRIETGWDVLIVARPGAVEASFEQLAAALERLLRRAGVLRSGAEPQA